ncbi:MAG: hypothetical protein DYH04_14580 [Nitrospira sp. NTP2]|nr:hypothetical protein [Nitrospira sp. NTP2]RIK60536.1 MAG: hypothetical protein DCC63_02590 [Nitrospira sp.]
MNDGRRVPMNNLWRLCAILVMALFTALSGCAFPSGHVRPLYTPEPGTRSPMSTVPSSMISVEVEDERDLYVVNWLGDQKNNFGSVLRKVLSDNDPPTIVREALTAELLNNGHKIVDTEGGNSDAIVRVTLKRYWSDMAIHAFDVEMKGSLEADIVVLVGSDKRQLVSKPINGSYRESRQFAGDSAFESVLNGALHEFVRAFSRDPEIVDALRSAASRKEGVIGTGRKHTAAHQFSRGCCRRYLVFSAQVGWCQVRYSTHLWPSDVANPPAQERRISPGKI